MINALSRSQLDEVGLTSRDIILINQIIGFVGFQARAIAVLQAALGFPVRWIPGMPQQEEAPAELFTAPPGEWQSDLEDPDLQYADDERQHRIASWQSLPGLGELAPLLACDPPLIAPLETLIRQLSTDDAFVPQVALLTARTNGSATCFDAWLNRWQGEEDFASHLRQGEHALHRWLARHPQSRVLVIAVQLLTRSPDRFSAAQLTPLAEYGLSTAQAIDLLTWSGLCGWMNRLKIALGNVRQQT